MDEYSDYKWVGLSELDSIGSKVDNTGDVVKNALRLLPLLSKDNRIEV